MFQELNSLQPHENFRLWVTAEVHPKFPTILLQSSLKITYEVGWKKVTKMLISIRSISLYLTVVDHIYIAPPKLLKKNIFCLFVFVSYFHI